MTCKEPRLHNILPQYGLKMGLAGIPVSTPPLYIPNDGFCIADFLTGTTLGNWIYPSEMGKEFAGQEICYQAFQNHKDSSFFPL